MMDCNTGCPKKLLESGEQYIVVSRFSSVFPGCLTRGVINATSIVYSNSTIKLNNFSSDKKHNLKPLTFRAETSQLNVNS